MPTIAPASSQPEAAPTEAESFALAQRLARSGDFSGAVRAWSRISGSEARRSRALQLARTLADADPHQAERWAMALPPGLAQDAALGIAAEAQVRRDAATALNWALQPRDGEAGRVVRRSVAGELGRTNARVTLEQLRGTAASGTRDEMLVLTASAWARHEPNAALDWVRALPDDALKQRLISSVGFEIAQTTPDRAMSVAEMLPAGRNRWLLVGAAAQTWIAKDPQGAMAWVKTLPAGEARDAAYAGFDAGLGVPSSRRIANAPGTRGGTGRTRGGFAAAAALRDGDSPSFELWLASQRPGMSREEAILEYVRQRGSAAPGSVGQWLASLPSSTARDHAMEVYVENLLNVSPRDAAEVLRTMPRSERTHEMVERTARRLLLTNPQAAEMWMEQMGIPQFRREELLRGVSR